MPKINVRQKNLILEAPFGVNLMVFLQSQGVPVASSCLGDGICGKCRMRIHGQLPEPIVLEVETLKRNRASVDERLACQVQVDQALEVETSYW